MEFEKLPQIVDLRGKTEHNGWQPTTTVDKKTDHAIHHSLTDGGDSYSFARYHVLTNKWPEIAYHFVILKDGTIQWNHDLFVVSYHVGNSNKIAVGTCLVGDFRYYEPTNEQKKSLHDLDQALRKDLPNYKRTRGHNEFPGYSWKKCPEFDYNTVIQGKDLGKPKTPTPTDQKYYRIKTGTFRNSLELSDAKARLEDSYKWLIYEIATTLDYNPSYRLITGTFQGKNVAEYYADKIRDEFGWTVYVIEAK